MCAPVNVLPDLRPGFLGIKQLVNGLPLLPTRNLEPCLFTNSEERSRSNPINFSYARTGLKLTTFRHAWEGACTEAKISGLRFHDLRHTFATRLRGKGVHEMDIMTLLGHTTLQMTSRYSHAMPENLRTAVESLTGGPLPLRLVAGSARSAPKARQLATGTEGR